MKTINKELYLKFINQINVFYKKTNSLERTKKLFDWLESKYFYDSEKRYFKINYQNQIKYIYICKISIIKLEYKGLSFEISYIDATNNKLFDIYYRIGSSDYDNNYNEIIFDFEPINKKLYKNVQNLFKI